MRLRSAGSSLIAVGLLIMLLAGCGWQLRGAGAGFGGDAIYIDSRAGDARLSGEVARTLRDLGARIVEQPEVAENTVALLAENVSRATLAVDERGRATEYELRYLLRFAVRDADGEMLGNAAQAVRTFRTYDADPLDTLAEETERERVLRDLREEAVNTMVARIARIRGG